MVVAWLRADAVSRRELVELFLALLLAVLLALLLAVLLALGLTQVVLHLWPQPRPLALHLGTQLPEHANGPGLPSNHDTVFWALAPSALATRRCAVWGFPLFAAGLAVGWGRVLLGVHFPCDAVAAMPVALTVALAVRAWRTVTMASAARLLHACERLDLAVRAILSVARKS